MIDRNPMGLPHLPNVDIDRKKTPLESKPVQRGKVLIVDDEIDVVSTLQGYLSETGYKTLGCTSAKGALESLKKHDFDILLIDLAMPEMSGIELLKAAMEIDPHLIGIIITGKGTIESAVDAMKEGAFDYLTKPFEFALLSPILTRAMKVRELSKSEDQCRAAVAELTYEVNKLQNDCDKSSVKELENYELKEQIEALKETVRRYKEMHDTYFFNGGGFDS